MSNTKAKALLNRIRGVKKALINKTSDVLSAPARAYHGAKAMRSNNEADILRTARDYDNAPDYDDEGNATDARKYRSAAETIRSKHAKK